MSYVCRMISEDILETIDTVLTWESDCTYYWYYNIKTWERSITGKQNEVPSVKMMDKEIDWVTKHYLPKTRKLYEHNR